MQIKFFCPRWGSENIPWFLFFEKVKAAGYDGVEWAIEKNIQASEIETVQGLAEKQGIQLIAQHFDTNASIFSKHYDDYAKWLENIKNYPWAKINSQTGKDYFSFEENSVLVKLAGEAVLHETHRGKFSYAAHITMQYLEEIKNLRLTLDISHWVNVAESFLEDQEKAVQLAIERTDHLHARVGYTEGPQIPDPRDPQWQFAVDKHIQWWDIIVSQKRNEVNGVLTITPEFGPWPYLVNDASQWDMNVFMMNLLKKRYA